MTKEERLARREEIAGRCAAGEDRRDVAVAYGLCLHTVDEACRMHKVPSNPSGGRTCDLSFKILADLMVGRSSDADIAKRYGVTRQRVHQIHQQAMRAGVPGMAERGG